MCSEQVPYSQTLNSSKHVTHQRRLASVPERFTCNYDEDMSDDEGMIICEDKDEDAMSK